MRVLPAVSQHARTLIALTALACAVAVPASAVASSRRIVEHLYQTDVSWQLVLTTNLTGGTPGLPTHLPVGTPFTIASNVSHGNHLSHGWPIGPAVAYCHVTSDTHARCNEGFAVFPNDLWLKDIIECPPNINGCIIGSPSEATYSTDLTVDLKNPFNAPINGGVFNWAGVKHGFETAVPNGHTGTWDLTAVFYK